MYFSIHNLSNSTFLNETFKNISNNTANLNGTFKNISNNSLIFSKSLYNSNSLPYIDLSDNTIDVNDTSSDNDETSVAKLIAIIILATMVFCFCWSNYEKAQKALESEKYERQIERQQNNINRV